MRKLFQKLRRLDSDDLVHHSLLVMVFSHLGSASNLIFHVIMGRTLSKSQYGVLASMIGIFLAFSIPLMALQNTLAHYTTHLREANRMEGIRRLFSDWIKKIIYLGGPVLVLALSMRQPLANLFHLESITPIVLISCIVFSGLFVPVLVGIFQGMQSFVWMCMSRSMWQILRLAIGVTLVFSIKPLATYGLAGHLAAILIAIVSISAVMHKMTPPAQDQSDPHEGMDRYFVCSLIILLSFSILMNTDVVLVKIFFDAPADYGSYARASNIGRTIIFLVQPLAFAMFPKVVSRGTICRETQHTLSKALLMASVLCGGVALFCTFLPGIPLMVLFRLHDPAPEMIALVRGVVWAMAPLGPAFVLLNFEIAQRRFGILWPVLGSSLLFLTGVILFHTSLTEVVISLAISAYLLLAILTLVLYKQRSKI